MTGRWIRGPAAVAGVTFAAGVLSTAALAGWLDHRNSSIASQRFNTLAQRVTSDIALRMRTYEYGLRAARGAALAVGIDRLDRGRFGIYSASRDFAREFPGARGIGIIHRLPGERYVVSSSNPRRGTRRQSGWTSLRKRRVVQQPGERWKAAAPPLRRR